MRRDSGDDRQDAQIDQFRRLRRFRTEDFDPVEAVREIDLSNTRACLMLRIPCVNFSPLEQPVSRCPRCGRTRMEWPSCGVGCQTEKGTKPVVGMARTAGLLHDIGTRPGRESSAQFHPFRGTRQGTRQRCSSG